MTADRQQRIEQKAYEIWQREGRPHGRHDEHWREAEAEVAGEERTAAGTGQASPEPGAAKRRPPKSAADDATPRAKRGPGKANSATTGSAR